MCSSILTLLPLLVQQEDRHLSPNRCHSFLKIDILNFNSHIRTLFLRSIDNSQQVFDFHSGVMCFDLVVIYKIDFLFCVSGSTMNCIS